MKRQTPKTEDLEIFEIGERLAKHSQEREISARGRITELFPYIYQASRRMSTRAISEFLDDNFGLKLSAVGVSRALKDEHKHWEKFAEIIEPEAAVVARAQEVDMESILENEELFLRLTEKQRPIVSGSIGLRSYEQAVDFLKRRWFALDEEIRENCLKFLAKKGDSE
jgi:hypothetical protein